MERDALKFAEAVPLLDGGFAVRALDPRSEVVWSLRYDAGGRKLGSEPIQELPERNFASLGYAKFLPSDDGGVANLPQGASFPLPRPVGPNCYLQRDQIGLDIRHFDPEGYQRVADVLPFQGGFPIGQYFLGSRGIERLNPDCHVDSELALAQELRPIMATALPAGAGLVVLGTHRASNKLQLQRLTREAAVEWRLDLPDQLALPRIAAVAADGDLLLWGRTAEGPVWLGRVGPNGEWRWQVTISEVSDASPNLLRYQDDGAGAYAVFQQGALQRAFAVSDAGAATMIDLPQGLQFIHTLPSVGRQAPLWLIGDITEQGPRPRAMMRLSDGKLEHVLTVGPDLQPVAQLGDGSLLASSVRADAAVLTRLDQLGREVATIGLDAPRRITTVAVKELGDQLAQVLHLGDGSLRIRFLTTQGQLIWESTLEAAPGVSPTQGQTSLRAPPQVAIEADMQTLCVWRYADAAAQHSHLSCFDRQQGGTRIESLPMPPTRVRPVFEIRPDGNVQALIVDHRCRLLPPALENCLQGLQHATVSPVGTLDLDELIATDGAQTVSQAVSSADRRVIAVSSAAGSSTTPDTFAIYSLGNLTPRERTTAGDRQTLLAVGNDGGILLELDSSMVYFDGAGVERWRRSGTGGVIGNPVEVASGDFLVLQRRIQGQVAELKLSRVSALDGSERWTAGVRKDAAGDRGEVRVHPVADAGLVFVHDETRRRVRGYSLDNGQHRGVLEGPKNGSAIDFLKDGSALLAADEAVQGTSTLRMLPAPSVYAGAVSPVQVGLNGAWHAPTTDGQGLYLRYLPRTRQTYGAWFTYAAHDPLDLTQGHSRSGLSWFSLSSNETDPGTAAEMTIYRNRGGRFVMDGETTSIAVGRARLRMLDCERAELVYRFDAPFAEGEGSIPLVRPADPAPACEDWTETTELMDEDQLAGTWFVPAQSGQGLLVAHHPATASRDDQFSAAWFTFDVAGTSDDPDSQHWFTLVADQKTEGELGFMIYRTIGGRFDRAATNNSWPIGRASLRMVSCDEAKFTYRFEQSDVVGKFSGLQGSQVMFRLEGCH